MKGVEFVKMIILVFLLLFNCYWITQILANNAGLFLLVPSISVAILGITIYKEIKQREWPTNIILVTVLMLDLLAGILLG